MDNPNPKAYRLPTHTHPTHYDIHIDARIERKEVPGKVVISLDIKEPTDSIELHARDMTLNSASLQVGGETLDGEIKQDEEREMAALRFSRALQPGSATLTIEYDGQVSPGLEALYLAKDGPEVCLCTQCEETDARGIFPCWDEPAFKARFAWNITTDPEMTVLANGPLESVEDGPSPAPSPRSSVLSPSRTWRFKASKPMSSYLVALVIGDVAGTPEETVEGTPISVWGMKGKEQMGEFAHGFTARLLPWYEEYFGAPYHFDKYDQVAVPGFSAGAMENSGLVLFRQSLLLMDPRTTSLRQEQLIALVVAHEFAHMWFGNLVTMKWWDDLWLNEAFAEWIAYKVTDTLAPEYEVWNDFQQGKNAALVADAQVSTHPIYSPVETPAQAAELFDVITYQKGSSVMRMLENYLGHEPFRNGLRTYMKEFAEDNAVGADLWRHLQAASSEPVTDIMQSWITQDGYPVISMSLDSSTLNLGQRRFFSSPEDHNALSPQSSVLSPPLWQVPLVIKYEDDGGEQETRYLLTEREATLPLDAQGEIKWLYANLGEIGFYRQNPDEQLLKSTLANLDKLTPLEQVGLLGDQWALVRNATHPITRFLDVLSAMARTNHYSLTEEVVGHLHNLEKLLAAAGDLEAVEKFRAWVEEAYKEKLSALGFEGRDGEAKNDTLRRASVISAMASIAHNREAIDEATRWADREADDPAGVDPNVAGTVVAAAAHFGDAARFDRYRQVYEGRKGNTSPHETNRYLYSFAQFRDPDLLSRAFALMDDDVIPQEGIGPVLRQMFTLRHAAPAAWDYMQTHWQTIRTLGDQWTGSLVLASGQLPETHRAEIVEFYDANLNGVAERSYARALETMDQMAEFKARTKDDLVGWFKSR